MSAAPAMLYGYPVTELELIGESYYLFETGEYVGENLPEAFTIKDDSSLEWVMQKLFDAEADEKAEADKIEALLKAYEARKKRKAAKVAWLRARFSTEIEAYAKTKLDGKTKYVDTPFGRIQWRNVKGGVFVADKQKALEFAKSNGLTNAIKITEEFQVSKLSPEQKAAIETELPEGFEHRADYETFSIKTAVNA